ncbi:MAG: hypothetical protein AB1634_07590 [Thermodesulfobacteriota bacterium]
MRVQANSSPPPRALMPEPLPQSRPQHLAYAESFAEVRNSQITLTTDEGDVVTLSSRDAAASSLSYSRSLTPGRSTEQLTSLAVAESSYSVSITGSLSEEETADIDRLLEDLGGIAASFFDGELDQAVADSLSIGELGSLAEVSATFTHTATMASALKSVGPPPLPPPEAEASPAVAALEEEARTAAEEADRATALARAQWDAIRKALDEIRERRPAPAAAPTAEDRGVAAEPSRQDDLAAATAPGPQPPPAPAAGDEDRRGGLPALARHWQRAGDILDRHPHFGPLLASLLDKILANLPPAEAEPETAPPAPAMAPAAAGEDTLSA